MNDLLRKFWIKMFFVMFLKFVLVFLVIYYFLCQFIDGGLFIYYYVGILGKRCNDYDVDLKIMVKIDYSWFVFFFIIVKKMFKLFGWYCMKLIN